MDTVMLSRIQFASTTIFHYFFVPVSIGLALLIAIMETMYVRKGNEEYKKWRSSGESYSSSILQ